MWQEKAKRLDIREKRSYTIQESDNMLTDDELRIGYMRRFNRVCTTKELHALKCFIRNFEVEHYTDFDEMYDAIELSMKDVSREVDDAYFTNKSVREVLRRRYSKL